MDPESITPEFAQARFRQLSNLTEWLFQAGQPLSEDRRRRSLAEGATVALFRALIETAESIVVLLENKRIVGVNELTRTLLERAADLLAMNTENYFRQYELKFLRLKVRELKTAVAKHGTHGYFRFIPIEYFQERLDRAEKALAKVKAEGIKELTTEQRMTRAGLLEEYEAMYGLLSSFVHSDPIGLTSLTQSPDGPRRRGEIDPLEVSATCGVVLSLLLQCYEEMRSRFPRFSLPEIPRAFDDL